MPTLKQSGNLKHNNHPLIWMESDIKFPEEKKIAILVATQKNKSVGYSIENLKSVNLKQLQGSVNETLQMYAKIKQIETKPIILVQKDEISKYQKYFKELPAFDSATLVIEDFESVQKVVTFGDKPKETKINLDIVSKKTSPKNDRYVAQDFSTIPSNNISPMTFLPTYTTTTSQLKVPITVTTFIEFYELEDVKWQRIGDKKLQFEARDPSRIAAIITRIHKEVYKDKQNVSKEIQDAADTMVSESSATCVRCSEDLLKKLFRLKNNPLQLGVNNFDAFKKAQEIILNSFEQKRLQTPKLTSNILKILNQNALAEKNTDHNPTLYRFETMKYLTFWYLAPNAEFFTVGTEIQINEICNEIIERISKAPNKANLEQKYYNVDECLTELKENIEKQTDGTLKLKVNLKMLKSIFGKPKMQSVKIIKSHEKNKDNLNPKIAPELFLKNILDNLLSKFKFFTTAQQLEILKKICDPKGISLEELCTYTNNLKQNCTENVLLAVETLRGLITGVYNQSSENQTLDLEQQSIIFETYDFLGKAISSLQNDLKAETSFKKIHEKFYQTTSQERITLNSLPQPQDSVIHQPPVPTYNNFNKRKFVTDETDEQKVAYRKIDKSAFFQPTSSDFSSHQTGGSLLNSDEDSLGSLDGNIEDFMNSIFSYQ